MSSKNILVTGGLGFIGSHTVIELYATGYTPIIIDNLSNSELTVLDGITTITGHKPRFYQGDFQDKNLLEKVLGENTINGVIHFAAFKAVGESVADPIKYYNNNVGGFIELLETIVGHHIPHFVFSSTAAVYGNPPGDMVTEETACVPESPYGWSKYMNEIILRDTCTAKPYLSGTALRYFNVVGGHASGLIGELPKGPPQNLLPIIVQAVSSQIPPLTVYGTDYPTKDGTCLRDYIHVVDLAKAHIAALNKATPGFTVYNIGTSVPTSVLELIKTFERVNRVKVPHVLGERRAGDPVACYAVADKALAELGWEAHKTIEDAVRDAWNWQQKIAKN